MKEPCYISATGLVTPLGFSVQDNFNSLLENTSALTLYENKAISETPFYAALLSEEKINLNFQQLGNPSSYTKLEKMMLLSMAQTIAATEIPISEKTALVVATTKGNVDALDTGNPFEKSRAYLPTLAKKLADFYNVKTEPIIVSNACVSGILAVAVAKRMILNGLYDNAIVVAGDLVTKFTLSGFQSFNALSNVPCKPYSKYRKGITLGEAAASVFISKEKPANNAVEIIGEASCNDANHISGPSRTGEGLYKSIAAALQEAKVEATEIDFISAHGTATVYNDEMESIAFTRQHMQHIPLHSLKGVFGHTLGASGLLETVIGLEMMKYNTMLPSFGFDELGVSKPLHILQQKEHKKIDILLKTASGFGGCNTAVLFKKVS
ncbi:beta-ketoacyl synthase N-terminal-like domain-containing protein [Rasiella sp. SM2506]|uniref:beta-ketoacyl synthase N-terminal-like domain-containing protein n=1 Tax=Rasiella sp. SM2506 TaxID=3423914 RepID=UPI003D7BED0D